MKNNWSRRELEALGEPINPVLPTRMSRMAGGGGKGSAPAAPDYAAAAEAQGKSSVDAINAQTQANRPDIYTPFGSQTWTQDRTFDQAGYDAAYKNYENSWVAPTVQEGQGTWTTGQDQWGNDTQIWNPGTTKETQGYYKLDAPNRDDFYGDTQWTQTTTLTPEAQAALDSQMQMQQGRSDIANSLMPQAQEAITTPIDYDSFSAMGTTPTASNFQTYDNAIPAMQTMGSAPILDNMDMEGLYRSDPFAAQNLPNVDAFRTTEVPNTPEFNEQYVRQMFDKNMEFMRPDMMAQQNALDAKLAAQGIGQGTKAWENAQRRMGDQQYRDKTQALNNAFGLGSQMYQNQLAGDAQTFNQNFNQNQAIFNNQLSANRNAFDQQNATWNNNYNLQNSQFNQRLGMANFNNAARLAQNNAQLANRGFNNNIAANQFAMQNQQIAANNAIQQQQFAQQQQIATYQNQLRQQQIAEAQQRQLQPLNNINALMTGQQVGMPSMPSFNTAGAAQPVNYLGAAQMQGQYNLAQQQMDNASANSLMGGAFSLGGKLGSAALLSDRRAKRDIKKIGKLGKFNLYSYRYIGSQMRHVGVMADEVKKVIPEAVTRHRSGFDMVNYSMLGA